MSGISTWIMSIAGVSVLSVIIDLIMPNGQTKKYIKGVFAFIIVFVIISPLPNLVNKNFAIDDIFQEQITIQDSYIYEINRSKVDSLQKSILQDLDAKGISGVDININANIFSNQLEINTIFVDLSQAVINPNIEHIDINELIKSTILMFVSIDTAKIIFVSNS